VIVNEPPAPGGLGSPAAPPPEIAELEFAILLDSLYRLTGYDFREYAVTMVKRRIHERVREEGLPTVTSLLDRALHEPKILTRLLDALTSRPSVPFTDPSFFRDFRATVIPWLRTFPFIRTWVIGSASDAYSVAITLREEALESRARIYATKPTYSAYERAQAGYLAAEAVQEATHLYKESGGCHGFNQYVRQDRDGVRFIPELRESIVFSKHHLPSDGSFNEFHLVIARGVFPFYGPAAAYRAHRTIYQSLARLGVVTFGAASSLGVTPHAGAYEAFAQAEGFFKRIR
jgi:chemotaxis protein methyltransferase CheR